MRIYMELLSDAIFGNGLSIPGGEDISVVCDEQGFPFFRGSTLKGVFREELLNLLVWKGCTRKEAQREAGSLLGESGDDYHDEKILFGDFTVPETVKMFVLQETGDNPDAVLESFTHLRTFTALDDSGCVKEGSLRTARCVNRGIVLEGRILCGTAQEELVAETLSFVKAVGTMRNRGFGAVRLRAERRK